MRGCPASKVIYLNPTCSLAKHGSSRTCGTVGAFIRISCCLAIGFTKGHHFRPDPESFSPDWLHMGLVPQFHPASPRSLPSPIRTTFLHMFFTDPIELGEWELGQLPD